MSESSPRPLPTTTEINPLTNIIIGKKNQCSNYNVVTTPHQILRTEPVSIRLNCNVIGGFRQWCKFSGFTLGDAAGKALLEFMQNHPQPQVKLTVAQDIRKILPDTKTDLKLGIAKQELRECLNHFNNGDQKTIKAFLPSLRRAVKRALQISTGDEELNAMLKRAGGFLK
jgi:hypothetical protein